MTNKATPWIPLVAAGLMAAGRATAAPPDRMALEEWVDCKQLISRERQEWRVARETVRDRIDLVRREIDTVRERTAQARGEIGDADTKLAELQRENDALKEATAGLRDAVTAMEARVRRLLTRSPANIRERVNVLSQRMPPNPEETKVALSERFQNVIGILNEINKYAVEASETVEVRALPSGAQAEVAVLYMGLGQAYYCNRDGGVAGIGIPGADGWAWQDCSDRVADIAHMMAVRRNETPAVYVPIPATVATRVPAAASPAVSRDTPATPVTHDASRRDSHDD